MTTRPQIAPVAAPTAEVLPPDKACNSSQVTIAKAADILVFAMALADTPFGARADPPLKPNQPNQMSLRLQGQARQSATFRCGEDQKGTNRAWFDIWHARGAEDHKSRTVRTVPRSKCMVPMAMVLLSSTRMDLRKRLVE